MFNKLLSILKGSNIDKVLADIKIYSDVTNKERKKYFSDVINSISSPATAKECLAVAYSHLYSGAENRVNAIINFEKYLNKPVKVVNYNMNMIFSDLGKAYEAEYDFNNAEKYYLKLQELDRNSSTSYILLAKLYSKQDIKKAVIYLENVLNMCKNDERFKHYLTVKLNEMREKQSKGYVYRPRKRKE